MKRWAFIKQNFVDTIVDQETEPTVFVDESNFWVEVTGSCIGPGHKYNKNTKTFSEPDPLPVILSKLEMITKLDSAYPAIINASKTDVDVEIWLEKFRLTNSFNLSDAAVISSLQFLITKNLISQSKIDNILKS